MILTKINNQQRYQEIAVAFHRKGCYCNDYLQKEVDSLVHSGLLYEYCDNDNAFLFVRKEKCLRIYYYLNNLERTYDFDIKQDLVTEILFRGDAHYPKEEIEFLQRSGFFFNLRRDMYSAQYKNLEKRGKTLDIIIRKANTLEEVHQACEMFNTTFDVYSGDYIPKSEEKTLFFSESLLVAIDGCQQLLGALHQTKSGNTSWISHVSIKEECRGKGIGKALLDTFIETNNNEGKGRYMLWVQASNKPAVNMYMSTGFQYINKSTISMLKLNK